VRVGLAGGAPRQDLVVPEPTQCRSPVCSSLRELAKLGVQFFCITQKAR